MPLCTPRPPDSINIYQRIFVRDSIKACAVCPRLATVLTTLSHIIRHIRTSKSSRWVHMYEDDPL